MFLSPSGAEDYDLTIKTTPQLTSWEASFDGGTTWVAATIDGADNTHYTWLLRGPNAVSAGATLISDSLQPLVRSTSAPRIYVRKAPYVTLETPDAL